MTAARHEGGWPHPSGRQLTRKNRPFDDDEGASLTEISSVVTILGGVSALVLLTLTPLVEKATAAACLANQNSVRKAAVAYLSQSAENVAAPSMAILLTSGFLNSVPRDVYYTVAGTSFEIGGMGPCA